VTQILTIDGRAVDRAASSDPVDHADVVRTDTPPRSINGCLIAPGSGCNDLYAPGADLRGADLSVLSELGRVVLDGADLRGANLSGLNLVVGFFRRADLSGARLAAANLEVSFLDGANVTRADLSRADLGGASGTINATRADFTGAKGLGASLRFAAYCGWTSPSGHYNIPRQGHPPPCG
jgi:uncharacterized protein YjbI with pentapeptide repeats